ncbi:MAG: ABC transporter permease [Leucobacter sp.]
MKDVLLRVRDWLTGPIPTSVLLALIIGGIFMLIAGANPWQGFVAMFDGALGDGLGISNTLQRAIPLVGLAMAIAVAFRAGVINLGAEGQMILGGLVAGVIALTMPGPAFLVTLCALVAAVLVGAFWASIAAFLQSSLGVPILIASLLLNYPARYFSSWMIRFPLEDPESSMVASHAIDQSVLVPALAPRGSAMNEMLVSMFGEKSVPVMIGSNVNWSLFIIIAVVVLAVFMNSKTRYGFESGIQGKNTEFARYSGVNTNMVTFKTMMLSGGLAGLFGALLVIGAPNTRIIDGALLGTNYAWTGLLVALLALYRPVGVAIAGTFFAAIMVGSAAAGRELGLSPQISAIIQALVIILLAFRVRLIFKKKRASSAGEPPPPQLSEAVEQETGGRS